ncbi:hypothetical protein M0802_011255 [Mischocyttarus mexicanus]|nr:hypothetical protein M0802_011255 [Mischocyttarus mexicanus]
MKLFLTSLIAIMLINATLGKPKGTDTAPPIPRIDMSYPDKSVIITAPPRPCKVGEKADQTGKCRPVF